MAESGGPAPIAFAARRRKAWTFHRQEHSRPAATRASADMISVRAPRRGPRRERGRRHGQWGGKSCLWLDGRIADAGGVADEDLRRKEAWLTEKGARALERALPIWREATWSWRRLWIPSLRSGSPEQRKRSQASSRQPPASLPKSGKGATLQHKRGRALLGASTQPNM